MNYFETNASSSSSISSSFTNNSGTIIMFVLLGVVVLALLGFILYSYIRDKIKVKKTKAEIQQFSIESKQYANEITVEINEIIQLNKKALQDFQVSVGKVKMSDINHAASFLINDLLERDRFKRFIMANKEQHVDFLRHLNNLKEIKPNSWDKKILDSLTYFENKYQEYLKTLLDHNQVKSEQENIKQIYDFEIQKSISKRERENAKA